MNLKAKKQSKPKQKSLSLRIGKLLFELVGGDMAGSQRQSDWRLFEQQLRRFYSRQQQRDKPS